VLYIFTETEDVTECDLAGLWPLLSEQRVKRVEKYRYFKDRKLSVLAYVLLRFALIEEYGINEMIEFEFGPYGKPFIKGFPELQFNLSHAAGGVACALAKSPVGVDIADVDERNLDCITSAMHPLEQDVIKRSKDKARTFARFWSMKESFLKYVGTGIRTKVFLKLIFQVSIEILLIINHAKCMSLMAKKGCKRFLLLKNYPSRASAKLTSLIFNWRIKKWKIYLRLIKDLMNI
jgi:Phosphopantetheinyl transferase